MGAIGYNSRFLAMPPAGFPNMMTMLERLCRALAVVAFLLAGAPASIAVEEVPSPDADAGTAEARRLIASGRFDEALAVLRPLTQGDRIYAEVIFLLGLTAIEASRHTPEEADREALLGRGHRRAAHVAHRAGPTWCGCAWSWRARSSTRKMTASRAVISSACWRGRAGRGQDNVQGFLSQIRAPPALDRVRGGVPRAELPTSAAPPTTRPS